MKNPVGVYIHIPFCVSKCPYCDFYSLAAEKALLEDYTESVCRAIRYYGENRRAVDSVYFGGGTPSLMEAKQISRILDALHKTFALNDAEITLEANPASALDVKLRDIHAAGVNRISFGVQSAVEGELYALKRAHSVNGARSSVIAAHDAGFDNISADLMLGIPYQTEESLEQSIDFFTGLPLSHISAYMLKIEEGTPFFADKARDFCPGEDTLAEIYLKCVKALANNGFSQYEISNFAKKGKESRHNLKYWRCEEYLGFGPSAHSFLDGRRFYLPRDLGAFIKAENPMSLAVSDGEGGGFEEYAMLRLRLCEGLDLTAAAKKFNINISAITKKAAALENHGLLSFKNNIISLAPKGFLLSNAVTAELLYG